MKVLVIGGYGVFGGRLAALLRDLPLEVLIAGRSADKAKAFCAGLSGAAAFKPLAMDRANIETVLAEHRPGLVVDCSGPFQDYPGDGYDVIRACITAGAHYLDIADGSAFVPGVAALHEAAKAAGVFAISGVSTFPVISAAALREIAQYGEIETVSAGMAPTPYAGMGPNVLRVVLGYTGARLPVGTRQGIGLGEARYATIAVPGHLPLRRKRFSLVDVPDLTVIPPQHPKLREIWVGASAAPELVHCALNGVAQLRAWRLLPDLRPLTPLAHWVLNRLRFGPHRGGMFVAARLVDGRHVSWHLIAEGDDGPMIPGMAIAALIRRCLAGDVPAPGARAAVQDVTLEDYAQMFEGRAIYTGQRVTDPEASVYAQVLGEALQALPDPIRKLHDSTLTRRWQGEAQVTPGSALGRILARIVGFPTRGGTVPVTVTFAPNGKGELWTRSFDGQILKSYQSAGTGRDQHLLLERFGPVTVLIALEARGDELHLVLQGWRFAGIPMPKALLPGGASYEAAEGDRFRFHVDITVPLIGRVVRYIGWLTPLD